MLGLAATHSSGELNLVLVDYKGGATFAGLASLPHTSALITNLADEAVLVQRMGDALAGELQRRQEVLRAAGPFASRHDLELARTTATDPGSLPRLPSLLVVVDEFSEMLAAEPAFLDLFGTLGRLGRSLGVHLLLASQRLEEGRLRGLESHLSYRVGLRTFSAAESRAVLGVPDAASLPGVPGAGYLRTGPETLVRFTAAYVSGTGAHPGAGPARTRTTGAALRRPLPPGHHAHRGTRAPEHPAPLHRHCCGPVPGHRADPARERRRPPGRPRSARPPRLAAAARPPARPRRPAAFPARRERDVGGCIEGQARPEEGRQLEDHFLRLVGSVGHHQRRQRIERIEQEMRVDLIAQCADLRALRSGLGLGDPAACAKRFGLRHPGEIESAPRDKEEQPDNG